ncbi:hypothetical protein O6H91_03G086200 [Diphasiastrum complanatum]|uniref:Uncharacterized protein n=1 Tax=Diphasiastrum complanatum TaxID=34168 RepID=A0ACC2E8Z3_DIPCM|nr:hypothetical protein O6H91_03G086200 [Diphasiastrum complanatum]
MVSEEKNMAAIDKQRKRVLGVVMLAGGAVTVGGKLLHVHIRALQKEQLELCEDHSKRQILSLRPKVAVDTLFAIRLGEILRICVPSLWSREALYIMIQSCLLYCRTRLTEHISTVEGATGQSVISQDWSMFLKNLVAFTRAAVPAALVNSGLKYMQTNIGLTFQQRLAQNLHGQYVKNRVYYLASTFGGLSNTDQRITEDVAKFSFAISELFSYTFKPVLDIILFTRILAKTIGYKGQLLLLAYFLLCSVFLRAISPPLALMTAQEAALSGNFRNAHQRIVTHAEEIAFNDPPGGDTEHMILNDHLYRLMRHSQLSAFQKFLQQAADGYFVKYAASVVGLCVYAAPFYLGSSQSNHNVATKDYIRSMRLMMNTSSAVGQLVLAYKRLTALSGYTSRVSELLESVRQLNERESRFQKNLTKRISWTLESEGSLSPSPPHLIYGDSIKLQSDVYRFENVTLCAPDGTLLVRELSFEVLPGNSVIVMGPNGSGKSSLLRVLAELWPLQSGSITRPPCGDIFYLSQRPYVVRGTLRDQVRYPKPPLAVLLDTSTKTWSRVRSLSKKEKHPDDTRIAEALNATEIGYLLHRGEGLDQLQNWEETLSGGERQRLAIARLLFHHPRFAVLDECTSAISADGEEKLYKLLRDKGITMLSIAHRPAVKRYHSALLYFDGSQSGYGWRFEKLTSD